MRYTLVLFGVRKPVEGYLPIWEKTIYNAEGLPHLGEEVTYNGDYFKVTRVIHSSDETDYIRVHAEGWINYDDQRYD